MDGEGPAFTPEQAQERIATVEHWYHQIEVAPGVVTPGINDSAHSLGVLPFPADCSGLRVLDVGARDGFFSFEAERRGAQVVAIDYMPPDQTGFAVARELLGSKVEFAVDSVYALTPERYGRFDLVLFLGVLYHLRNPMLALDRLWSVCQGDLIVETQISKRGRAPAARFHPGATLNGDNTNWWTPNPSALQAMLEAACFDVIELKVHGARAVALASRSEDPERAYWRAIDGAANLLGEGLITGTT